MQFFLDEAGPFDTPGSEDTHKAAVVVSVAVPDQVAPYLKERFFTIPEEPGEREGDTGRNQGTSNRPGRVSSILPHVGRIPLHHSHSCDP